MNFYFKTISIVPFIALIKFYQWAISPWLGNNCRFQPTCSHYCIQALETFGILEGSWKGICRLSRCHPWGGKGYDPIK